MELWYVMINCVKSLPMFFSAFGRLLFQPGFIMERGIRKNHVTGAPALEDRDGVDVMADAVPSAESLGACQAVCLLNESCTGILAARLPCGSLWILW